MFSSQSSIGRDSAFENARLAMLSYFAITNIQALARGYLARRRYQEKLRASAIHHKRKIEDWAVVAIQKVARGYIARKTLIRSLKIRQSLSPEILRHAEKYLLKGDIWGFLSNINDDIRRAKHDLRDQQEREDEWASTFLDRIINQRQREFDSAWNTFSSAVHGVNNDERVGTLRDADEKRSVPGPLLRRAVQQTVKVEIEQVQRKERVAIARRQEAAKVYSPHKKKASVVRQTQSMMHLSSSSKRNTAKPIVESLGDNFQINWMECGSNNMDHSPDYRSLLIEIPLGMEDSLERLLFAAALRCYVPDFLSKPGMESCYSYYINLPIGLAKTRFELECKQWIQKVLSTLRMQGITHIAQVAPISKFVMLLQSVEAPSSLVRMCADIYITLRNSKQKLYGADVDQNAKVEERFTPQASSSVSAHSKNLLVGGSRMLEKLVEKVENSMLESSVEELLVNAAFLILPHGGPGSNEEMGQHSFQRFAADIIDPSHSDEYREDLIRRRFRAAVMLATPYTLALKERNVMTAEQLMQIDLREYNLPPALYSQVEITCNSLSYRMADARILPVLRDQASQRNPSDFLVPMFYDTRFQRTPFDVFGKTPLPSKKKTTRLPAIGHIQSEQTRPQIKSLRGMSNSLDSIDSSTFSSLKSNQNNAKAMAKSSLQRQDLDNQDQPQVFKKTLVCPYPHCKQVFSRLYTYNIHMKSHDKFPQYHSFKRNPQLGLDEL